MALFDGLGGIALDALGNLFVADSYSSVIRKITPVRTNWVANTIGGLSYINGIADGINSASRFNEPYGICVGGNGAVYVTDTCNHTIRAGKPVSPLLARPNVAIVMAAPSLYFAWQTQAGLAYQLQSKTNLLQETWHSIDSPILATNTTMTFNITSGTDAQRFYRIMVLP